MKKAVVVGSGHAGCEAALALARMGIETTMLALNLDSVAFLACNPSIGGTAKGHLVCEIDALGGEMGIIADKTTLQRRMLNESKGPAVHSLRAQVDKVKYHTEMKKVLETTKNLWLRQAEASEIIVENGQIKGVKTAQGATYLADAVVICTGVYLQSDIIIGEYKNNVGPNGFAPANLLTKSLVENGISVRRFKTGTPVRIHKDTIDFSQLEVQNGDENIQNFSFMTKKSPKNIYPCYLTYTNEKTHKIILDNLDRAPLFNGSITSLGPRYCPSIESKIVNFADKDRHQLFLEPEASSTKEMYLQGFSTSMPIDIQEKMVHSLKGFEHAFIMRDAYAIEYDCIDSTELDATLCYKNIKGLYFAGQVNGTSGYEEAAAQGIIAGINAALYLKDKEPLILKRSDAYIGVLIDDLVTKGTNEPYRMMTSRAEYRLLLRQDNADSRLTPIGYKVGLVTKARYNRYLKKMQTKEEIYKKLRNKANFDDLKKFFETHNESIPNQNMTYFDMLKRSNIFIKDIVSCFGILTEYPQSLLAQIEVEIKYDGYIKIQQQQIEQAKSQESIILPQDIDYKKIKGLRIEAQQKLQNIRPYSLGQASRISGVSPADIAVLSIYLKTKKSK